MGLPALGCRHRSLRTTVGLSKNTSQLLTFQTFLPFQVAALVHIKSHQLLTLAPLPQRTHSSQLQTEA